MDEFHTLKGYQLSENEEITPAMEDYLEMIYRVMRETGRIKLHALSEKLNVRPPSASKMVQRLCTLGYLTAEKYGDIMMTGKGAETGEYLLYRHNVIHRFLCELNGSKSELEEAEKIEHFLSRRTVDNLAELIIKMTAFK